ncbi:MAG: acyltransferase [Candidatus Levybacteria bacterium]|nr:acyltransferase [Candidatus Levybacteria bacterium]
MLLRWVGNIPSHLLRRFFYRLAGIRIGKGSTIHMWANFFDPKGISIGNDSIIGDRIMLDGRNIIRIGDHVGIASEVMIYNSEHDIHSENFVAIDAPVIIEDYVFIGPRAIILPGVTIRMGGIVAAGAVVTKDVEQYSIVGGVPAKVIGERKDKKLNYKLGRSRWFR